MNREVLNLRSERANVIARARAICDVAEKAHRQPTAEEQRQFSDMMDHADGLEVRIADLESRDRLADAERSLAQSLGRQSAAERPGRQPGEESRGEDRRATPEYRRVYDAYLRGGLIEAKNADESRALQTEVDNVGGYLRAPQQMVDAVIKAVDNLVVIRQLATKYTIATAASLGVPTLDTDPDDADWTTELATGSEDSAMRFGKRQLSPHPLAKRIKCSNTLLRQVTSAEGLVRDRLAYKFGVASENGYMTGDGASKPLGLFTASADGIPTNRDVTGGTTTAITADGLIDVKYSLKSQYMASPNLRWLFHRDAVKMVRKLKDSQGQYLWQPGLASDRPDSILDVPVIMSEYVPNTFTTGLYVGMLGDFSYYWIADAMTLAIQRLVELYAETNQTGFIGRLETDGMPVLAEAFSRVKLA